MSRVRAWPRRVRFALLGCVLASFACGEHYDGGGRRRELPKGSQSDTPPSFSPSGGASSTGGLGTSLGGGEAGTGTTSGGAE